MNMEKFKLLLISLALIPGGYALLWMATAGTKIYIMGVLMGFGAMGLGVIGSILGIIALFKK